MNEAPDDYPTAWCRMFVDVLRLLEEKGHQSTQVYKMVRNAYGRAVRINKRVVADKQLMRLITDKMLDVSRHASRWWRKEHRHGLFSNDLIVIIDDAHNSIPFSQSVVASGQSLAMKFVEGRAQRVQLVLVGNNLDTTFHLSAALGESRMVVLRRPDP